MAILTADQYFGAARQRVGWRKTASRTTIAAQRFSMLDLAGNPGAGSLTVGNTTTGLVPTDATAGFPLIGAFSAGGSVLGYLGAAQFRSSVTGGCVLYDRLFHVGSIALNALGTTTLSAQPSFTARLPGGNNYSDVDLLLEINAAVSATATTVAVNYNDENATAQNTAAINVSGFTTGRVELFPLAGANKNARQINSVTVGGTVATTGSVNIILARRLAEFDIRVANAMDAQGWDIGGSPLVYADSALWPMVQPDSTSSGLPSLSMTILNG